MTVTQREAIELTSRMAFKLLDWMVWTWIALAQLLVLQALLVVGWCLGLTPSQIAQAFHHAFAQRWLADVMLFGVSPLGLLAWYWGSTRLAHRLIYESQWIATRMTGAS